MTGSGRSDRVMDDGFVRHVLGLCHRLGLRTAHFRPAWAAEGRNAVAAGWPDLVVVGSRMIVRALVARATVAREQVAWLDALTSAGVDAGVWRPQQWLDGTIEQELRALVVARHG